MVYWEDWIMQIDIRGQLNSMSLPASKALWPLFETVVNAIQAIEESPNRKNGKIDIFVEREKQVQFNMDEEIPLGQMVDFTVTDNGIGFTPANYDSFNTAYSTYKVAKGCKGIGRFLWLLAFDHAEIDSIYTQDKKICHRQFTFSTHGPDPEDNESQLESKAEIGTSVKLCRFKKEYQQACPIGLDVLAKKIVEHCLPFFVSGNCPTIVLQDGLSTPIELNEYFRNTIEPTIAHDVFQINGEDFTIYHMHLSDGTNKHELHLCANMQEVRNISLKDHIPNLWVKITPQDGTASFYYVGYVVSKYLDSCVNSTRTGFRFDKTNDQFTMIGTGEDEIVSSAIAFIKAYLADYLSEISKQKRKQIDEYVNYQEPQYRFILGQRPEIYERIPANLTSDALDLALHKEVQTWEREIKIKGQALEKASSNGSSEATVQKLFETYWKGVTDLSKTALAKYVVRRKAILKLLEDALSVREDGTFKKEEAIHSIICPMRHTSNTVKFEEMNLWIVDERLAYHQYLASDKTLQSMPVVESNSKKEPDIAVFDKALAYSDTNEPFSTVTLIEFKKPDNDNKNPINQVGEYVDLIRAHKKKKANGHDFTVTDGTLFRCYVICDLTDKMRSHCRNASLTLMPDGLGYSGFNQDRHAYVEVISYSKLLSDAKKRNQILFDKLFAPKAEEVIHRLNEEERHNGK